jgi:cold shock CspA family protein
MLSPLLRPDSWTLAADRAVPANPSGRGVIWKLLALATFTVLAPVIVPKTMPIVSFQPMWQAPLILLTGSIVSAALLYRAIATRLDSATQTMVSCEQMEVGMNCPPAQLWTELERKMQGSWTNGIPNRIYANIPPAVDSADRGTFQGLLLEETQPAPNSRVHLLSPKECMQDAHGTALLSLMCWGALAAIACAVVGAYAAAGFAAMERMMIVRTVLEVFALALVSVVSFKGAHFLWSRMQYRSRLVWIETIGTYQSSKISVGNQITGHAQSTSTLTKIEDATLRVWMADLTTVAFGKDAPRSVVAMGPVAEAATLARELMEFAQRQSSVTAPTSQRDIVAASSLAQLGTAAGGKTAAKELGAAAGEMYGRVKFFDQSKGFGFIQVENGQDHFFNSNYVTGKLPSSGDEVAFRSENGARGLIAKSVRACGGAGGLAIAAIATQCAD